MSVECKGASQPSSAHDGKTRTIDEAQRTPAFSKEVLHSAGMQRRINPNNFDHRQDHIDETSHERETMATL